MLKCLVSYQIEANELIILESYKDLYTNMGCMILDAMVFNLL